MEALLQDLRYAVRLLVKRPGFTAVVVLALGLGVGANSAIFSVVNALLLRPLPYRASERLVWIWEQNLGNNIKEEPASPPNLADWRNQCSSFDGVTGFARAGITLTSDAEPEQVPAAAITGDFFSVLGIEPVLGRPFMPEEDTPGNNHVVILSHGIWQRRFGSDPNIIGTTITLNSLPYTVVGIMPAGFRHPRPGDPNAAEMWVPLGVDVAQAPRRGDFLAAIARLKPDVAIDQASAEMHTIAARLEQQYPATNTGWDVKVIPLLQRFVGDVRPALLVLLGAVSFLLLIACANVANLLLARAASRQKEIAIRTALGAGRRRLVRQLLTESILLGLLGGAVGLLIAEWGAKLLVAISPNNLPRLNEIGLDGRVVAFTALVALATGLVFGLLPALQASNPDLNETLKEGGRSSGDGANARLLRGVLAALEVAFALMLLIGAGLMLKSFAHLQEVHPGFRPENVLTAQLRLPRGKYKEDPLIVAFYDQLLGRIASAPGVQAAGATDTLPLGGGGNVLAFAIEGQPAPPPGKEIDAESMVISPSYFAAMGAPLKQGRGFSEHDNQDAQPVVMINETMARRFWPDDDPIGKRITLGNGGPGGGWMTIVGIVGDIHNDGLSAEPYPQMFRPYMQNASRSLTIVVRGASNSSNLTGAIRGATAEIDRDLPLFNIRAMQQVMAESVARPRFITLLIAIFAALSLLLAALGVYGVMSYSVSQRTHEIGIRVALGARRSHILGMVVGQGLKLALAGIGVGVVGALLLTRLMSSLLFGVSATDPGTFIAISAFFAAVALLASYIPARRAISVDPMVALHYE